MISKSDYTKCEAVYECTYPLWRKLPMNNIQDLRHIEAARRSTLRIIKSSKDGLPTDIVEGWLSEAECWQLVKQGILCCHDNKYYLTNVGRKLIGGK